MLFAPRIAPRLHASILRQAATTRTPAEITRRLGAEAERRGLPRPCYEQVRVLVRRARRAQPGRWFGLELDVGIRIGVTAPPRPPRGAVTRRRPLELLPRLRR